MSSGLKLAAAEERLAEIIWATAPVNSTELAKTTKRDFGWGKSTTYTLLKRLSNKGVIKTENATVLVLVPKDEYITGRSRDFVSGRFGGSLPAFITSFVGDGKLSDTQADELIRLIRSHKED
ncbi:MAG: BlaI/MecI/CopY family transcriptional regulator [Oscillospiraceae bacterium]|jgi:predicted transcriptional regulator|nr:BlaI/MecI/CopY family transcriptional regulator [Oscillospiraceae bacterium]